MKPLVTMREALRDPELLGNALPGTSWRAWRVLLIAAMGEPLDRDERATFRELTQLNDEPGERVDELVVVAGRRGGKSRAISVLAAYVAALCDHRDHLVHGERGVVVVIAADQRQASVVFEYIVATLEGSKRLRQRIKSQTSDSIVLDNAISIEVRAASYRRLRGPTYVCAIGDELAFWQTDADSSANPDSAIVDAIRPGLSTTGGMLCMISSPYARRGLLHDMYRRYFGPANTDRRILVAQAPSKQLNPTLSDDVIRRAMERDPIAASAEYGAQFRSDIESFINRDVVEAAVVSGSYELPFVNAIRYVAFVDPSGGSVDSMTLGIAHREGERIILDAVRERRPPFSPDSVVQEFSALLKSYNVSTVKGDRYAGQWPIERFHTYGIAYRVSDLAKSDIYLAALPMINSGRIELLDNQRLVTQLCSLERRTARGGRDSVDHPPNSHDDLINAAAGALVLAAQKPFEQRVSFAPPVIVGRPMEYPGDTRTATEKFYEWANSGGGHWWGPV